MDPDLSPIFIDLDDVRADETFLLRPVPYDRPREPDFFLFFDAAHDPATHIESRWRQQRVVFRPPTRFALAKGLEHFINILLGPAGPPQHLPCDMFDVLHGHVVFITRRVVDVREA